MRGRFVTLEGGEGAGKSTVLAALKRRLERRCVEHRCTREPGGTPLGERIRELVLDPAHPAICPESEALLMFAARAQHVVETIEPALAAGVWVLCDRYTDASHAYQGGGRGVPRAELDALERWAARALVPDRTLLLDVPVGEGLRRVAGRGGEADRMERESQAFFERVRATYLERAAAEPQRFRIIDATRPLEEVVASAIAELDALVDEAVF